MPRFFEAGSEGPAKEITDEDEILRRKLRIKFFKELRGERIVSVPFNERRLVPFLEESAKRRSERIKKLLRDSNMTEDEWIDQQVEREFERIKNIQTK